MFAGECNTNTVVDYINVELMKVKLRVYLGVRTCEVSLCFVTIIFLGSIVLTFLLPLLYTTSEHNRFLH